MSLRNCRVTIQDVNGVSQTVEVTAATLYEAVAQGLAAIHGQEWVGEIADGLNVVKVSVVPVRVEHEVRMMDFTIWLERKGGFATRGERPSTHSDNTWHASHSLDG